MPSPPPHDRLISFPVAPELLYKGHGSAVSLPRLIVGTRGTRSVLAVGNINSDATGFDMTSKLKDLQDLRFELIYLKKDRSRRVR